MGTKQDRHAQRRAEAIERDENIRTTLLAQALTMIQDSRDFDQANFDRSCLLAETLVRTDAERSILEQTIASTLRARKWRAAFDALWFVTMKPLLLVVAFLGRVWRRVRREK